MSAGARDALADGALGTLVAEDDDLAAAIARCLAAPRPDPDALSRAVGNRFGAEAFRAQVAAASDRLLQPA